MGQTLLVDIDMAIGAAMLRALDDAGLKVTIALWVNLSEYDDWRFALYSRVLDPRGLLGAHRLVDDALIAAGIPTEKTPPIMILRTRDPFVKKLRQLFGKAASVEGMRLGGQLIGERFVNAAYVYRIT